MGKKRTVSMKKKKRGVFIVRGEWLTNNARNRVFQAVQRNKTIVVLNQTLFLEVLDVIAKSGVEEFQVVLDAGYATLGDNSKGLKYGT